MTDERLKELESEHQQNYLLTWPKIEELIAALKEAREDSKRLDHLISNGDPTNCPDGEFGLNEAVWSAALETDKGADEQRIRYVIDDAMKEGK